MSGLRARLKRHPGLKRAALALSRLSAPVLAPLRPSALLRYPAYLAQRRRYIAAGGEAALLDAWPCLFDRTAKSGIDAHYFHQAVWASRRIAQARPAEHVDIGSDTLYVGMLTSLTRVTFVDIRPLELSIDDYTGVEGSILDLPFADGSVQSLSCLHVIEHIGLGRYGDPIDPEGSARAAREVVRVLAPGGHAYLSMPIGRPRVQFNGQRVFDPLQVVRMFEGLSLTAFAMVDATGRFHPSADPARADLREHESGADSGLGLFAFTQPGNARNTDPCSS
jgi:SAM-dependent methyltransferase